MVNATAFPKTDGSSRLNCFGLPAAPPSGQYAWALFDWAAQPYFSIIAGFLFAPYFVNVVVGDPVAGQSLLGLALAVAGFLTAFSAPVMGAITDAAGQRKPWLLACSLFYVIAVSLHWCAVPGLSAGTFMLVMISMIVASVSLELAVVVNNAMLCDVAPKSRLGRLSGTGFALGYVGGLVAIILLLVLFALPGAGAQALDGLSVMPFFGLDTQSHEHHRIAGPFAALWYALFVLPLFLLTPDRASTGASLLQAARKGFHALGATIRILPKPDYRPLGLFLIGRMLYNDGLIAIFIFGAVYASGAFDWAPEETALYGMILIGVAVVGAVIGGRLDDRIGSKATVLLSLCIILAGVSLAASITQTSILFFVPVAPSESGRFLSSTAEQVYLGAAIITSLASGPAQAASRSLMARLAPKDQMTEFFGLFAFSGKLTAFIGPLGIGVVTALLGTQRAAFIVVITLILAGLLILWPLKLRRVPSLPL